MLFSKTVNRTKKAWDTWIMSHNSIESSGVWEGWHRSSVERIESCSEAEVSAPVNGANHGQLLPNVYR